MTEIRIQMNIFIYSGDMVHLSNTTIILPSIFPPLVLQSDLAFIFATKLPYFLMQ